MLFFTANNGKYKQMASTYLQLLEVGTKTSCEYINLTILFTYYIHFHCMELPYLLYTLCTIGIHLII